MITYAAMSKIAVDYENALPELLARVSPELELRTDRKVFEIAQIRPLSKAMRGEFTHVATSLGRYGTVDVTVKALLTKVALLHDSGSEAEATVVQLQAALTAASEAVRKALMR